MFIEPLTRMWWSVHNPVICAEHCTRYTLTQVKAGWYRNTQYGAADEGRRDKKRHTTN